MTSKKFFQVGRLSFGGLLSFHSGSNILMNPLVMLKHLLPCLIICVCVCVCTHTHTVVPLICSFISVTNCQLLSEHIKWKIPEINYSKVLTAHCSEEHAEISYHLAPSHLGYDSPLCPESPHCGDCPPLSH